MAIVGCGYRRSFSLPGEISRSGRAIKFALAAMSVAISGLPLPSHAYVLEGQSWPTGAVLVLQLSLGAPAGPLQDGSTTWNEAAAPVADMWSSRLQRVQITPIMDSPLPCSSGDGINSVVFANSVFGQAFGGSTLAVTYYRYFGSTMTEADVLFNRAKTFDSYRGPLQFPGPGPAIADIRRVFLHELGHGLGLGHPDQGGQHVVAVMNSIMSDQEVLSNDDLAGGQFLYGASSGTPTPTPTPTVSPTPTAPPSGSPSHLANISTRMKVGVSDNVLIGGFIVKGTESKRLMLRAIGPSLGQLGIPNVLADPVLELHNATGEIIASCDNWTPGPQSDEIRESGWAPASPAESAMIVTLLPGSYTAVVSGVGGGQGTGLVEAYELDSSASRLANIATRGRVGIDDDPMIGGFIVQGGNPKRIIIRALGPSLGTGPGHIAGALADPTLELRNGDGDLLADNDDWSNGLQAAEIVATGLPPSSNLESALIANLGAGNYTAVVRGFHNTTGVALVEAYDLDP